MLIWILFYLFIALIIAVGGFAIYRGSVNIFSHRAGLFKIISGTGFVIIGFAMVVTGLALIDRSGSYKERARVKTCASRLIRVGNGIEAFFEATGRMPESLEVLIEENHLINRDVFCPVAFEADTVSEKKAPYHYLYFYSEEPQPGDIIVADAVPHNVPHKVFRFMEKPRVNALYGDGYVRFVPARSVR